MSAGGGAITAPFGSVSLAELRSRALSERGAERPVEVLALVDPGNWAETTEGARPSFDELVAGRPRNVQFGP